MNDKHLSTQFDAELSGISTRVLEMGGLVESQVAQAIYALTSSAARRPARCCSRKSASTRWRSRSTATCLGHHRAAPAHGARPAPADRRQQDHRQPGARGRRGGAHRAHRAAADQHGRVEPAAPAGGRPGFEADLAMPSCARRWTPLPAWTRPALEVLKQDDQIDQEFDGLLRKLITYMMEDPRTISASIDLVFVAKAIERVGDHAKNLAEAIIYIVKGTDVRHTRWKTSRTRCAESGNTDEQRAGGRRRVGDRRADRHQPAPRGLRGDAGADAEQAQHAVDACCPTWCCWTGCCPARVGMQLAQALARRRAHARAADHHADRARRRGRQDHRAGRRRRRLPDQAVLHQGTAGAHPRRAAAQGPEALDAAVEVAGLRWTRPRARHAARGDETRELKIGPTEFRLLHFLMTHPSACTAAPSCWTASGATMSSSRSARSTCTSSACARRWRRRSVA
jgi:phosphate transport system protein